MFCCNVNVNIDSVVILVALAHIIIELFTEKSIIQKENNEFETNTLVQPNTF